MKESISSAQAPAAIGPYSQAIRTSASQLLFCSGQIPLDPATGNLVEGPPERQTDQVMKNIGAVLAAAGYDLRDIVKTTIYLTDLTTFSEVNKVYESYLVSPYPARSTLQVAALPRAATVEIEVIACKE